MEEAGPDPGTRSRVLDAAEQLVQTRGFNGFSYADIARELGITKAGLHYHFAGKAELGLALIDRYAERFADSLVAIEVSGGSPPECLRSYAGLYLNVLSTHRMCLCGILAAEYETLPLAMRGAIDRFFHDNEDWLVGVLESGREEGSLGFDGDPIDVARLVIGTLEGSMLIARLDAGTDRFRGTIDHLVAMLGGV